jgi:hypothetical protein
LKKGKNNLIFIYQDLAFGITMHTIHKIVNTYFFYSLNQARKIVSHHTGYKFWHKLWTWFTSPVIPTYDDITTSLLICFNRCSKKAVLLLSPILIQWHTLLWSYQEQCEKTDLLYTAVVPPNHALCLLSEYFMITETAFDKPKIKWQYKNTLQTFLYPAVQDTFQYSNPIHTKFQKSIL